MKKIDSITTGQGDAQSVATGTGNGLAKSRDRRGRWCCRGTVAAALAGKLKLRELTALSKRRGCSQGCS